jgi:(p)ppGpp synthase/HD superfamily hydrolase
MIIVKIGQFDKALMFSLNAYNGRLDKAEMPCILHPLRIAAEFAGRETWAAIALLHDVVEDTLDTDRQITLPDNRERI